MSLPLFFFRSWPWHQAAEETPSTHCWRKLKCEELICLPFKKLLKQLILPLDIGSMGFGAYLKLLSLFELPLAQNVFICCIIFHCYNYLFKKCYGTLTNVSSRWLSIFISTVHIFIILTKTIPVWPESHLYYTKLGMILHMEMKNKNVLGSKNGGIFIQCLNITWF